MNRIAIRPDAAAHLTRCQTAADLRAIREQWGDLLAAIERPPVTEWPPRETRGFLEQLADAYPATPAVGRAPLILREHPAPLNLDALDTACAVERALFDSCDAIAARVQRPVRITTDPRWGCYPDPDDRDDPRRWHLPTVRDLGPGNAASAGSRAHGLHWAAVWLEGRALGEDVGDLFAPLPTLVLDDLAAVARHARTNIERALQRDGRTTQLDTPCPWCGGQLTGRTRPGGESYVTCSNGEQCGAPVILDTGRRTWRGADLVGLYTAIEAARQRDAERA